LFVECDIFVQPSRSEACPIALLEAMAIKCVCVATDVGRVGEIVVNRDVAILSEPKIRRIWLRRLCQYMTYLLKIYQLSGRMLEKKLFSVFQKR